MLLAHLRVAAPEPTTPRSVDHLPSLRAERVLERRSAGFGPQRLRSLAGGGDAAAVDAAFARAARITRLEFVNNRLVPNAMEPRAANAVYTRHDDSYTLYVASQNPHVERLLMCAFVLGLPESKVRVIAPDVGGGFGAKIGADPEFALVGWLAKRVGRAVRWSETRSENMTGMLQGRGQRQTVTIGGTRDGRVLATHRGAHHFTVGQRKGLGVAAPEPLYVLATDIRANRVVAGPREALGGGPPDSGRAAGYEYRF